MSDHSTSPGAPSEDPSVERRSGADRRTGRDRRAVDLLRDLGRPEWDLRSGIERRSGRDRRRSGAPQPTDVGEIVLPDVVMPWQIAEPLAG
jgi:hypothetical protein